MGQIVDTETAEEFLKETLEKIDPAQLDAICADVDKKAAVFDQRLARPRIGDLDEAGYRDVLNRVFSVRRKGDRLIEAHGFDTLKSWTFELLYGDSEVSMRFQLFVDRVDAIQLPARMDLASEILHFTHPDEYWLWTRWLWDANSRTGALPLVTTAAYDFGADTCAEGYLKVGRALAFVHEVIEAGRFEAIRRHIFGTDVFLSCVYVIYAYTVLRLRMTQEFNKVIPGLSEFSRRLLGIHSRGN